MARVSPPRQPAVGRTWTSVGRSSPPTPVEREPYHRLLGIATPGVVAPPRQNQAPFARDPRNDPGRTSEGTLPLCPQSAYASRVAPATSAWGWPPPPPCAAAPFTALPLHAPSPPTRPLFSPSHHRHSSSSSCSSTVEANPPPPVSLTPSRRLAPLSPRLLASPRSNPHQSLPFSTLASTSSRLESAGGRDGARRRKRKRRKWWVVQEEKKQGGLARRRRRRLLWKPTGLTYLE